MMNDGKDTVSFAGATPHVNDSFREKYSRQILFAGIGEEGQKRLVSASAVIVGCGAIGAATANLLVRAGIGRLRIVDRDFVCLLYTSPSPRDLSTSRMPSSA